MKKVMIALAMLALLPNCSGQSAEPEAVGEDVASDRELAAVDSAELSAEEGANADAAQACGQPAGTSCPGSLCGGYLHVIFTNNGGNSIIGIGTDRRVHRMLGGQYCFRQYSPAFPYTDVTPSYIRVSADGGPYVVGTVHPRNYAIVRVIGTHNEARCSTIARTSTPGVPSFGGWRSC